MGTRPRSILELCPNGMGWAVEAKMESRSPGEEVRFTGAYSQNNAKTNFTYQAGGH